MAEYVLFRRTFVRFFPPFQTWIRREAQRDDDDGVDDYIPWRMEVWLSRREYRCPTMDMHIEQGDQILHDVGTRQDMRIWEGCGGEAAGRGRWEGYIKRIGQVGWAADGRESHGLMRILRCW